MEIWSEIQCVFCSNARNVVNLQTRNFYSALRNTHKGQPISVQSMLQLLFIQSELNTYLRNNTGEKPYHCCHCDNSFLRNSDLIGHLRIHRGEKTYKCRQGNETFSTKSKFPRHMRPLTGNNIYSAHLNTHGGETMSVPSMLKVFINLGVHMMVHTGEKAYESSHVTKLSQ